jgi:hypothetical protein
VIKLRTTILGLLITAVLTACASDKVKAENKRAKDHSQEYVDYYPTGSNIPVKVRKDQLQTPEGRTAADQKALQDAQTLGSRPNKDPAGPK